MKAKYAKPSEDLAGVRMGDVRLDARLQKTTEAMERECQSSILSTCGDRHGAKAFYALLGNDKFSMEAIETEAYNGTGRRIESNGASRILMVQDTCDINLNGHKKTDGLGYCSEHVLGVKVHSCVAFTTNWEPLGLISQQYETRPEKKIIEDKEQAKLRPIEEKESYRWLETARKSLERVPEGVEGIVVCDREGDFYELYAEMQKLGCRFVVRLTQDRATLGEERSIQQLRRTKACGEVEVEIPRDTRNNIAAGKARMEVAYCTAAVARPKRVSGALPASLTLTMVRITEIDASGEPVEWLLATNLPIANADEAMVVVGYYVQRWKIEQFHRVLKGGCQVEKIQQRSYERIKPVLFIYSLIAVFILAMTLLARSGADLPCDAFLDENEWKILFCLVNKCQKPPAKPYPLKSAVAYLGELGSFRHAPSDGDYGVKAIWSGLFKLFIAIDAALVLMGQV